MISEPHTANVILETGARMNIIRANVEEKQAEMIVEVSDDKHEEVMQLFRERGIEASELPLPIILHKEKCVHCGACISVCPMKAFSFKKDWKVGLEGEKCIQCEVCITACPLGALELPATAFNFIKERNK